MRCLWLTRIDPSPEDTGELIYSAQLIRSLADAGAAVTVLCLGQPDHTGPDRWQSGGAEWRITPGATRAAWRSIPSRLPNLAYRCAVPGFRNALEQTLAWECWDTIVIDSLATGWALPAIRAAAARSGARPPKIVYVSHNHEETTRARIAAEIGGNPLRRAVLRADARKAAALERRLVYYSDLVTAISPNDQELYAERRNGRPVVVLTPGYRGRRVAQRAITEDVPRRVVMVGSFEWGAKKANLSDFVHAAAPVLQRSGVELSVVGKGGKFIDALKQDFSGVEFTGRVDDIYQYLDRARIAVVPERLGGGFKLKALDYVFNRLPIAALDDAFAGMPLINRESVLSYPDLRGLAHGLVSAIDDLPMLNRLQQRAYDSCSDQFEWSSRGRTLYETAGAL